MTAVLNALPLIGQVEIRNRAGESGCGCRRLNRWIIPSEEPVDLSTR